jgi:hypothetical protein
MKYGSHAPSSVHTKMGRSCRSPLPLQVCIGDVIHHHLHIKEKHTNNSFYFCFFFRYDSFFLLVLILLQVAVIEMSN